MDIKKLADDSMIYLSKEEEKEYLEDMDRILSDLKGFKNLEDIEAKIEIRDELTPLRSDLVGDSFNMEEVFKNTESNKFSYFFIESFKENK